MLTTRALSRLLQLSNRIMRPQHVPVFFTVAAVISFRPLTTLADAPKNYASKSAEQEKDECPFYGCPLLPTDVHYHNEALKEAFEQIRDLKRGDVNTKIFQKSGRPDAATFTLIGYKGGSLQEQINQDRSLVINPYYITEDKVSSADNALAVERILLGVFDGHAPLGEQVSEYTVSELPKVLAKKLKDALIHVSNEDEEIEATKSALSETFIELDKTAPAEVSGGCTATVVLKQGSKIYLANAGDSRSFIVSYRPSTKQAEVLFITREDKPDLQEERERVEKMGGQVYIPVRGTSRVVYHDPRTGAPTGLAMSRSIGDWAAGKLGVIPDPKVDVFDIDALVQAELSDGESFSVTGEGEVIGEGLETDDVYIFAVSATDGLMDFLDAEEIARVLSHSLYEDEGSHVISACERLIFAAANAWQQSKQGRYRDDIAIAVSTLRTPPREES